MSAAATTAAPLPAHLADLYLERLGVEARRPDDALLAEIAARHHARVPFENFTKLRLVADRPVGRARHPSDERFVRQLHELGAGDTCFGIAHALARLLAALGFHVQFAGARVEGGRDEDAHVACVVTWRDHPLLVDCGFATPLFEPVPLERTVVAREVAVPWERHRIVPAPEDRFRLETWDRAGGEWRPRYHLLARARPFEHFHGPIDRSFDPRRPNPFLAGMHAVRNEPERQVAIRRDRLIVTTAKGEETEPLASSDALVRAAERHLGLARDHGEAAARALREVLGVDPFDPERRAG